MWRWLYTLILSLLLPFILIRLWWRGNANPDYRLRIKERLGYFDLKPNAKRLWLHAVSVGEVNAAVPLIKALHHSLPEYEIVVTTMTPTGAQTVKKHFPKTVIHRYVPYDLPWLVNRALDQVTPSCLIVMETEIWPNWITAARDRHIPVIYMSLRLSDKSFSGYQKIRALIAPALNRVNAIAAQTQKDADRVVALGAIKENVKVFGNIKYDASLADDVLLKGQQLRQRLGKSRLVWIGASTHTGEDEQLLSAHKKILQTANQALLILVPRHPERFDQVFDLCQQQFNTQRRTQELDRFEQVQVYLGDTMGELLTLYAASDICFVGGSLVERGGQNVLEPWLIERPVIVGPHMFNFSRITEQALDQKALIQVTSAAQLADTVIQLADSRSMQTELVTNATGLLNQNKGALKASMELLKHYL